jgi:hypothetical protein
MTPLFYWNDDAQLCAHLTSFHSYALHPSGLIQYLTSFLSQNLHPFTLIQISFHPHNLYLFILTPSHPFYPFIITPSHAFYPLALTPTKHFTLAHSFISLWPCTLCTESSFSHIFTAYILSISHFVRIISCLSNTKKTFCYRSFFRSLKLTAFPSTFSYVCTVHYTNSTVHPLPSYSTLTWNPPPPAMISYSLPFL